jgi:hypothetical protein
MLEVINSIDKETLQVNDEIERSRQSITSLRQPIGHKSAARGILRPGNGYGIFFGK